jgi:NAD-dependent dihydropyrimidine dehydrogenase PreA subunit
MAFVITKPCIGVKDTACVAVCPADCIHPTKSEADFETAQLLYIDPENCICCNLCTSECPVNAIFQDQDVPEQYQEFIELNAAYYRRKDSRTAP